jgi:hypothetical protein
MARSSNIIIRLRKVSFMSNFQPIRVVAAAGTAFLFIACLMMLVDTVIAAPATQGWSKYKNERFGFQLSYPGGLFIKKDTPNSESGALWTSTDGAARLLATATPNETSETLESYREFVMRETYPDARFDYTPQRDNWFVLSGQKGDTIFYERITFVCQGRFIYGWQVNYPAAQKRKYDAIVEAIHSTYKAGRGEGGACGT